MRSFLWQLILILHVTFPVSAAEGDCGSCHTDIVQKWSTSHHAKSMLLPSETSILGDFSDVTIEHHNQKATFSKGDDYLVKMTDKGGKTVSYKIAYTFGYTPLQQYLVKADSGKFQVLPFAWDARDKKAGGQRWFHVYPKESLPTGDRLHWQQPLQNWNGMCADCHSTGLKRNYDVTHDLFKTTFSSMNVSCGSCHAASAKHASFQRKNSKFSTDWKDELSSYGKDLNGFKFKEGTPTATWSGDKIRQRPEMQVCAACHSLRSPLTDGIDPASKFLDQFSPALLEDTLYFPDGQIKGEVYVWGSFLQSKMYKAGVSCFDCHDSHSLKLKAKGNNLCTRCHSAPVFDTRKHHKHPEQSKGAMCVFCHMPERTYMVVDPRRDHSFKVPRPDISSQTASPNACTGCHRDQNNAWAMKALKTWFPDSQQTGRGAMTFQQAQRGNPKARRALKKFIEDDNKSAIKRASALALIPRIVTPELINLAKFYLNDPSPLMRIGAIRALSALPMITRYRLLKPLLNDPVKAVRVDAARVLLDSPEAQLHTQAFAELLQADKISAWRGEGRLNLGLNYSSHGDYAAAEQQYRQSLNQDPSFTPALINLTELLRQTGRENEALMLLEKAAAKEGNVDPMVYHALGLAQIRQGKTKEAVLSLEKAKNADRRNPRYAYVYLVALNSMGQTDKAYRELKNSVRRHRYDANLLRFALSLSMKRADYAYAKNIVSRLLEQNSNDIHLKQLREHLP